MLVVLIVRIPEDKTLPPGNDLKKADGSKDQVPIRIR